MFYVQSLIKLDLSKVCEDGAIKIQDKVTRFISLYDTLLGSCIEGKDSRHESESTLGFKGTKKEHFCIYCTLNNTGY